MPSVLHRRRGIDVEPNPLERPARPALDLGPIDQPQPRRFAAEQQVLGDRELRHQGQLLGDERDAAGFAVVEIAQAHRLAVEQDFARKAARGMDAAEHLDQRRLAGAVLAAQRVHLARFEVE